MEISPHALKLADAHFAIFSDALLMFRIINRPAVNPSPAAIEIPSLNSDLTSLNDV